MRQFLHWVLPVVAIVVATAGCSATQRQQSTFGALSGRIGNPAAATPAQLAGDLPGAVQPPAGGYQASSWMARRFQIPKCMTPA